MKTKRLKRILLSVLSVGILFLSSCSSNKGATADTGSELISKEEAGERKEIPSVSYLIQTDTSSLGESDKISDTLYGIFLEDINFAIDGGLYAELIKNRSFEYGPAAGNQNKHGWVLSDPSQGDFSFIVADGSQNGTGLNSNNLHYAVLENKTKDTLGIFNKGFLDGLSVKENTKYTFSGYFKSEKDYEGPIYISIRDKDGYVFASGTIDSITAEWRKYSLSMTASKSSAINQEIRFYVELEQGSIWADMLSLMPSETYQGTGVRKDIGEYLEALHPSFFRFPGGCVIEGRDTESIYRWKDSIGNGLEFTLGKEVILGDVAARPQGKSIWSGTAGHPYYTTHGIGFYEFFVLSELWGAEPLPVLNAGMTCQPQSPRYIVYDIGSPEFEEFVQDALDLAEFCRGDETTEWGAVRIAMGHPEPFTLNYIGIGNEQWQREYFQHYLEFVKAFEAAALENPELYGGISLVLANGPASGDRHGWNFLENNPDEITALIDEHYYESPNWFLTNTTRYDRYDRDTQAGVFLGEYAARSNTLEAALAEAAYMTGLERNSDIVKMACYAPLFGNAVSNQWNPDLIWFSGSSVYGSPNYYVQKLFSNYLGTRILPSKLEAENLKEETVLSGKAGLGTWQTSAAFDNLKVISNDTGDVLYESTFDDFSLLKDQGWNFHEGEWSISEGRLVQGYKGDPFDTNTGDASYFGNTEWSNYTLTVDAEILSGREGFLIPVCVENTGNQIFWNLGGWGNTVSCLQSVSGNAKSGQLSGTVKNAALKQGQVYHLKVVVSGNQIQCFVNDMKYVDYTYDSHDLLYETVSIDDNGDIFIKLVNVSETAIHVNTTLKDIDLSMYEPSGDMIVLRGDHLSDMNSFLEPEKLVPENSTFALGETFVYTAPGYSVNILHLKAK